MEKAVVKGVKWTSISTLWFAASNVIKISVLARFLEDTDFGLMAILSMLLGLLSLFSDLGLSTAILHKQGITKKEYASLFWLNLFFCLTVYVSLFGVGYLVAWFYEDQRLYELTLLIGVNVLFFGLGTQFKTIETKQLSFKFISIFEIVAATISLIGAVIWAVKDYGVLSLVYSSLLHYGILHLTLFVYGLKKHGLLLHFKWIETLPFLKIGFYQVGGQFINYFNRDLDILLVGKFFSTEILGGYSLAKQLVFRPMQIINPILMKVATPALALVQEKKSELKQNYLTLLKWVSTVNIPIYIVTILTAPLLVWLFYGNEFDHIVPLVQLLSVYMLFRAFGNPIGSLVTATGKTHLEFYWNLMNLFIAPVFIFIGAQGSIEWVAIALGIYMLAMLVPSWKFLVHRMTGASLKEFLHAILLPDPRLIIGLFKRNGTV